MQVAYLHVVINHLPIMGVPIGVGLLALGAFARSEAIKRAALLVFVALGVATVAVYLAGQGGEDFVEHVPGVSEDAIERHEDMAGIALGTTLGLALLSLVAFLRYGGAALLARRGDDVEPRRMPGAATMVVLLGGLATSAVLGYTGKLGGQIRHTEFLPGGAAAAHQDEAAEERAEAAEEIAEEAVEAAEEAAEKAGEAEAGEADVEDTGDDSGKGRGRGGRGRH